MRKLLHALTIRGRSFVAAGLAAAACGILIPEPDLLRIGALLMVLPLLSAFGASRARYRLSCTRRITPARLPAGQSAELTIRLANVSRLRTGLLLAEDSVPYALGRRPRFVLDGIGGGGSRQFHVPARVRHPGQVHDRAAPGAGGRLVRAGVDHPRLHHHEHADRHAPDRPAEPPAGGGELARRQRARPAQHLGQRR